MQTTKRKRPAIEAEAEACASLAEQSPGNGHAAAEYVAIELLLPWIKNPRKNEAAVAPVAESIRTFGFGAPVVARRENNEVIAGHTRLKAAKLLGLKTVPVRYLDISEEQAHQLALADNKLNELAEWDKLGLAAMLGGLETSEANLLGWDNDELDRLAAQLGAPAEPDEEGRSGDSIPLSDTFVSKPGELYELGPHRLFCGDSRNPKHVAKLIGSARISIAFTSPPYASQRAYDEQNGFKPIPEAEFVEWFDAVQANVRKHLAADGSWFVNIKAHALEGQRTLYVYDLAIAHVRQWKWRFIDELCWKRHGMPGRLYGRFKNAWEPVLHFAIGLAPEIKFRPDNVSHDSEMIRLYKPASNVGTNKGGSIRAREAPEIIAGLARPSNVIEVEGSGNVEHSATFPVDLPMFFIRGFTDRLDAVYDPFLGSGTTLLAAAQLDRVCYGMELSPRYCDLIRKRWTAYAKQAGIEPGPGALEA